MNSHMEGLYIYVYIYIFTVCANMVPAFDSIIAAWRWEAAVTYWQLHLKSWGKGTEWRLVTAGPGCELGCVPASKISWALSSNLCISGSLVGTESRGRKWNPKLRLRKKNLALRTPILAAIFDPLSGAGKIEKSRAETRAKFWLHVEVRHTELRAVAPNRSSQLSPM